MTILTSSANSSQRLFDNNVGNARAALYNVYKDLASCDPIDPAFFTTIGYGIAVDIQVTGAVWTPGYPGNCISSQITLSANVNSATRAYEYADDTTSENWLTLEQATALRTAAAQAEVPGEPTPHEATAQAAYQEIILPSLEQIENSGDPAIESLLQQPDGRARLHEEVMKIAAELLATTSAEG